MVNLKEAAKIKFEFQYYNFHIIYIIILLIFVLLTERKIITIQRNTNYRNIFAH